MLGLDEIEVEGNVLIEIRPWRLVQAKERSCGELTYHFKGGMFRDIHVVITLDQHEGMLRKLPYQVQ